jgi:hypothetical protein
VSSRATFATTALVAVLGVALLVAAPRIAPAKAANPGEVGRWSAPFTIGTIGTHATLLRTGEALFFIYPLAGPNSGVRVWNPETGALVAPRVPTHRNLFCAGHSVLADGRVLITGGTEEGHRIFAGTPETTFFDPLLGRFLRGPLMANKRWYPSNVTLPDGDVLILSGEPEGFVPVAAVERYQAASATIATLPSSADKLMHDYPRAFLLPNGKVLTAGQDAETLLLDPQTAQWTSLGAMTGGGRYMGTAVLLPGLTKVLALGGNRVDPLPPTSSPGAPTETAEILDLAAPQPAWRSTAPLHVARQHANAVLLPDGTVLVVGGGQLGEYEKPVRVAERFDPASETWTALASQRAPRCYHSTALLLPDGRVLSAGMDHGRFAQTAEIYSPPYLFAGPRPVIAGIPPELSYGTTFSIATPDAANVARVALLRPGSVTHAFDFEQRFVALAFAADASGGLTVQMTGSHAEAPPGWYMLFLVSAGGVPSKAAFIHLG